MTYEFKTIDEFVSYLETQAKQMQETADGYNRRSHTFAAYDARANQLYIIANMVRRSNLVVVTDYMRAALSKAVA